MKKKSNIKTSVLVMVVAGFLSSAALADSIGSGGFGNSTMKDITPVEKKEGECLSFEASFSEPLKKEPSAVLDIERYFKNMLNAFLQVTKISENKYRLSLTASTKQNCPELTDDTRVTVSTYSGSEEVDDRQILPESVSFSAKKSQKDIQLKKE